MRVNQQKLGICFVTESHTIEGVEKFSKAAAQAGFDSGWVAEHYFFRNGVVAASTIVAHAPSLRIGTGVVNPYTRHPAMLVMSVATLDEISQTGVILGLGASLRPWIEGNLRLPWRPPLQVMREAVVTGPPSPPRAVRTGAATV